MNENEALIEFNNLHKYLAETLVKSLDTYGKTNLNNTIKKIVDYLQLELQNKVTFQPDLIKSSILNSFQNGLFRIAHEFQEKTLYDTQLNNKNIDFKLENIMRFYNGINNPQICTSFIDFAERATNEIVYVLNKANINNIIYNNERPVIKYKLMNYLNNDLEAIFDTVKHELSNPIKKMQSIKEEVHSVKKESTISQNKKELEKLFAVNEKQSSRQELESLFDIKNEIEAQNISDSIEEEQKPFSL